MFRHPPRREAAYPVMLDHEPLPFRGTNDRLMSRWNKMVAVLAERSEAFWLELAEAAFHQRQYNDALVNVYQALTISPNEARAFQLKGMILQAKAYEATTITQQEAQIRAMLAAYQHVIQADPTQRDNIERRLKHLYYNEFKRGEEAFRQGQYDKDAFHRSAAYFKFAALIRSYITTATAAPDTPWGASVNQALSHHHAGQPTEARVALEEAVERGDTSLNTFLLLAELYGHHAHHEHAVRMLERARDLLPAHADQLEAHFLNACLQAGRVDEALSIYEAAVNHEPNNPHLRYNYGTLLLDQEAFEAAIEHLEAATRLNPDDVDAWYNLGVAYVNKAVGGGRSETLPTGHQKALCAQAVAPLEKARSMVSRDRAFDIDQALFLAYTHTDQQDKADALAGHLAE